MVEDFGVVMLHWVKSRALYPVVPDRAHGVADDDHR